MVSIYDSAKRLRESMPVVVAAGSGAIFLAGAATQNPGLLGGGAVALCATWRDWQQYVPGRRRTLSQRVEVAATTCHEPARHCQPASASPEPPGVLPDSLTEEENHTLVDRLIATGRYALLLHADTVSHLDDQERLRVIEVMEQAMTIVPEGQVLVGVSAERATWGSESAAATTDGVQAVEGFYVDRFAVTNAEYQHFVDAGLYEDFSVWHEEALPALFEFVDSTGEPGPKFWANGRYRHGEEQLPVVGISWYEAAAYARWVGKRLLTDAEWTKAAAWPVETTPGRVTQRRYPWGDSFESRRANLWNSGQHGPVAVDDYGEGASISGVYQLIGNTWEWTESEFIEGSDAHSGNESYRTIHGGAFNTYFENQATCHFRSGEAPLARRNNIGIRLGLSIEGLDTLDEE